MDQIQAQDQPQDQVEAEAQAQAQAQAKAKAAEHGWVKAAGLDYDQIETAKPLWTESATVYEFSGEEGDVGPPNEALEKMLFQDKNRVAAGDSLSNLDLIVTVEGPKKVSPVISFEDAGLHPQVLDNVKKCGYDKATAIQAYCIPAVIAGHDVVAVAQTGSGKTAAFLIPIISKLMGKARQLQAPRPDVTDPSYNPTLNGARAEPLVVIVCPTRELALQIFHEARRLCYRSLLRPVCAYGGLPVAANCQELSKGCDILVATPGRLCDLMNKPHVLSMQRLKFTVIDEADEMLDQSWEAELGQIMGGGDANENEDHLFLMFSATFPNRARKLAMEYMTQDYTRIRVGRAGSTHKNIIQDIIYVNQSDKRQALYDLLFSRGACRTLIFCNSTMGVEATDDYLWNHGMPTVFMHSKRGQFEREDALRAFISGVSPIMVATQIAGRGIDIANIGHVINYDLPSADHGGIAEYVHRIGRTGRIGHVGHATSFYNDRNEDIAPALVNTLLEQGQAVPDFLEEFKPEGGQAEFHDESEDEDDAGAYSTTGGGSWGQGGADAGTPKEATVSEEAGGDAWGSFAPAASKAAEHESTTAW